MCIPLQQRICRRSTASSIRCSRSGSRQLQARGGNVAAPTIHTQPLHSPTGTFNWPSHLRAIERRGASNGGWTRFSPNCSINPGTIGFAGKKHAPRRSGRSGATVRRLLYISLGREFTCHASRLPDAVRSDRCLPERKFAEAPGNRPSQRRARHRNRHGRAPAA